MKIRGGKKGNERSKNMRGMEKGKRRRALKAKDEAKPGLNDKGGLDSN
jgi:hypothetical protein